jgi:N-acetylneuraminate lyase
MTSLLSGILPALVTPLTVDERFAAQPMERLLERVYAADVEGVYVCGQTGEGLLLTLDDRRKAAEVAVRNSPAGKAVVVHVGAARTADAVELARHAARVGAHAVSSLPPAASFSFPEVRTYYRAIAAAAGLPVLVYYFPDFSRSVTSLDQIFELCSIPNVVGLKYTDFDLYRLSLISRAGHVIFNGRDEVLAPGILMGAGGGIGSFYNLVPELFVDIWQHASEGRYRQAREAQDRVNELIAIVLQYPMIPALKAILAWSGIDCGPAVAPRRRLTPDETAQLKTDLEAADFAPDRFLSAHTA